MVCAYTNAENKDRFVVTVGFLEAVVRAVRAGDVENTHCEEINALYDFLDVCFSGKLRLREYLDSYLNVTNGAVQVDVGGDVTNFQTLVAQLIDRLEPYLILNCRLMEVLVRRAAEGFDMATYNGSPLNELSPAEVDAYHNEFIESNSTYWNGECTDEEIKRNLPPYVSSQCSVIYLIENCVNRENIIDFLMNVTVDQFDELPTV